MSDAVAGPDVAPLLELLALDDLGDDVLRGQTDEWPGARVFGGLVAGQALWAAKTTVRPDHLPHSLHAYFMRPGRPGVPIDYQVERARDGRSFTTRTVRADQEGEEIFVLTASFHRSEDGYRYQLPIAPDAGDPSAWPAVSGFRRLRSMRHIDVRELGPTPRQADGTYRSTRRVWLRATGEIPDDPAVHACVITFMSDMGVVMAARVPRADGGSWERTMGASLDHAVWFHRPARADQWLLYDLQAVANYGARGLVRGTMHTRDGDLVVSVAQEALIRPLRPEGPEPHWRDGPELREPD